MTDNVDNTEEGTDCVNPLLIDLVLENIFSYIATSHLTLCRLVCNQWCAVTTQILRKRITLTFGDGTRNMAQMTECYLNSQNGRFPITRFIFQSTLFGLERPIVLTNFFQVVTSSAEFMSIVLPLPKKEGSNFLYNSDCVLELKKLKHLRFEMLFQQAEHVSVFERILSSTRQLQKLELVVPPHKSNGIKVTEEFVKVIAKVADTNLKCLKHLMLHMDIANVHLDILANSELKLESANFHFRAGCSGLSIRNTTTAEKANGTDVTNSNNDSLHNWMQSQKLYLRKLTIGATPSQEADYVTNFPRMENLVCFEVTEWIPITIFSSGTCVPFNFTYKTHVPKLRKLMFSGLQWQSTWDNFFYGKKGVCHTLQEMTFPKLFNDVSIIHQMPKVFPNLVKFELTVLPLTSDILPTVFEVLSNLEELNVSFLTWISRKCIDHIFTGLNENVCQQAFGESDLFGEALNEKYAASGSSIKNLQKLKSLHLKNLSSMGEAVITDVSGYLAFLQLKNLKRLAVWQSEMSDDCMQHLKDAFEVEIQPRRN